LEGTQWLKLGVILAVVLGSLYILMPTVVLVVEGPQVMLSKEVGDVKQVHKKKAPDTKLTFDPADPDKADVTAGALEKRLAAAKIPIERVHLVNDTQIEVILAPGGRKDKVEALAGATYANTLWSFDSVFPSIPGKPPTDADFAKMAGMPLPPSAVPLTGSVASAQSIGNTLNATLKGGDVALPAKLVVAVDGVARGVATANAATPATDDYTIAPLVPTGNDVGKAATELEAALSGPLPTTLTEVKAGAQNPADLPTAPVTAAAPSVFPAWFIGLLPDTPMPLGLDLQGGIDLTLQVELDEAILSQATRDAQTIKDQATRDGIAIDSARRAQSEPLVQVATAAPLGDLQSWMAKKLPTYEYQGTDTVDDKPVYTFRMRDTEQQHIADSATDQILDTLRKRIDATGVKEPSIVKKGTGRINVQLPGMVDLQSAIDAIGTTAVLEFRLVDEDFDDAKLDQMLKAAKDALPEDQYNDDDTVNRWLHQTNRLADDRLVLWEYEDKNDDHVRTHPIPLKDEVILTGNDIDAADVGRDANDQPDVTMEFKSRGAQVFCTVTGENVKKRFAIILDNEIQSAPTIDERICGGRAQIRMGQSMDALNEAHTLALVLRTGSSTPRSASARSARSARRSARTPSTTARSARRSARRSCSCTC